ncbi:MAG: UDP-N-acetylmuramoyl-tripeptide--D-alanyl-D-alanine ligase [Bifidobacteriaceae bacterium]|jgi:UDP-N-acetylmuramoyl-tripeptide--D-alanyl-D-alanine ligase|nr:UDP-N-acetylmuramoyl-tripeptide--D-alanyl-D-alanine ligase [Bifidobacteriaceae bacterium]
MIPWTPEGIATVTGAELSPEVDPAAEVTGVSIDSRTVGPGTVFVALLGERVDGADYVADAVRAGSPLAVVGRPVAGPTALVKDPAVALAQLAEVGLRRARVANPDLKVIGITGSVGKTTTKDLVARILRRVGNTVAARGSLNNYLGVPLTASQVEADTDFLVLEMGANHEGEIAELARIAPPDVALVLGVSGAHLGEFGSFDAIARAKAELVAGVGPQGVAVLNLDDPAVAAMAFGAPGAVVTFGFDSAARIMGYDVAHDPRGHLELTVVDQEHEDPVRLRTKLVGDHLAIDVLAALAGAVAAQVSFIRASQALQGARAASPHRMAVTELGSSVLIDDSYNASPESMAAAIEFTAELARSAGKGAVAVLGAMAELGSASPAEHRRMGQLVAKHGYDHLIAVHDAARSLYSAALAGGLAERAAEFHPSGTPLASGPASLADRIRSVLAALGGEGAYVLVKGSNASGLWRAADELAAGAPAAAAGNGGVGGAGADGGVGTSGARGAAGPAAAKGGETASGKAGEGGAVC